VDETGLHVGVGEGLQLLAQRADGADRRQALPRVVAVHLQVALDEGLEQGAVVGPQRGLLHEDLAEGFGLVEDPGVQGGDEGVARDEVHLQRQDAEEQVAIGRRLGHGPVLVARRRTPPGCPASFKILDTAGGGDPNGCVASERGRGRARNGKQNVSLGGIEVGWYSTSTEWYKTASNPALYDSIDNVARNNIVVNAAMAGIGVYGSLRPQVLNNTLVNCASAAQTPILLAADSVWVSSQAPMAPVSSKDPTVENNVVANFDPTGLTRMIDVRAGAYTGTLTLDYNRYYTTLPRGALFIG
jgi:parallel beta-helix repeat protein